MKASSLFTVSLVLLLPTDLQAIEFANYDAARHDRFRNEPAFIGNGINLSGVGHYNVSGGTREWVTLLSPNVFITAWHTVPLPGAEVTFYPGNDAGAILQTREIASVQQIGNTDLVVGTLDVAVTGAIANYAFSRERISQTGGGGSTAFVSSNLFGETALFSGISPGSDTLGGVGSAINQAVGRNIIEGFVEEQELSARGPTFTDAFTVDLDRNPTALGNEAASITSGDSGAPVFREDGNGNLVLLGINLARGTTLTGQSVGLASYVGNYEIPIQDFIDANPVPEPGTHLLGAIGLGLCCLRRKRSH